MNFLICVVLIVGVDLFSRFLVGYFFKSWGKIVVSVEAFDGQWFLGNYDELCNLKRAKVFKSFREARKYVDSLDLDFCRYSNVEILEVYNCHKKTGYRKSLP
jgi:hypothetical protein